MRVTFTIPKEAAVRLRQLAQQGNATLLQLGILSVQVEGDEVRMGRLTYYIYYATQKSLRLVVVCITKNSQGVS